MNGLDRLNALPAAEAETALLACCGAPRWARAMEADRPFATEDALFATSERVLAGLDRDDWLAAFAAHPRIGERVAGWSQHEQAGAAQAAAAIRAELARANRRYEDRFGHIFIVCASGKTAEEMLALLHARLGNEPDQELALAAVEQAKITRLRLARLLRS